MRAELTVGRIVAASMADRAAAGAAGFGSDAAAYQSGDSPAAVRLKPPALLDIGLPNRTIW